MKKHVNRSVRLPENVWNILKQISGKKYRSLNSQLIKIVEDWLVDHDFLDNSKRTRMDD